MPFLWTATIITPRLWFDDQNGFGFLFPARFPQGQEGEYGMPGAYCAH